MASNVLDDQLSDLDVGGMGRVVHVEKSSVAVEQFSFLAHNPYSSGTGHKYRFCKAGEHL
jgi:hypothetical protein